MLFVGMKDNRVWFGLKMNGFFNWIVGGEVLE